ncbi:MAG: hypothetical protein HKO07_01555 [Pseudomonadales bacterium]|nr:hypothetical protein [Pseudomonadales bacterium]
MFSAKTALLQNDTACMYRVHADGVPLPVHLALAHLQHSPEFRQFFTQLLRDAPFAALRLELPPLTMDDADQPFEFVLVKDISLERRADSAAFEEHLTGSTAAVAAFPNLGRDAFLLAPTDPGNGADYAHLAAFLRNAPGPQIEALWQQVGQAVSLRLNVKPIWLNCAGTGVPWLHVRIDTRPKYYVFGPYKIVPG